jgi:threonine/homoserine/homoserine lactone efflux protein
MAFFLFLSEAMLISLSGVLAPGPITAVAVSKGSRSPLAGTQVAIGHGLVEIPLMVAVYWGVGSTLNSVLVRTAIGTTGGLFLLWMGIGLLRNSRQNAILKASGNHSPVLSGVFFSVGNPYFLVWWGTVGAALIMRSLTFGILGFTTFALGHWVCDLGWNTLLSWISFRGGQFFGQKFQQVVFFISGIMLLFFGGRLVIETLSAL